MRLFGARSTAEAKRASEFDDSSSEFDDSYWRAHRPKLAPNRGFGARELTVSAFALASVAMVGALCALKGGDENVATSGSSGATLLKDSTQPVHVGVVRFEEQSIDLAQAPPEDVSPPGAFAPAAAGATQPRPGVSGGSPAAATVNTPVAAPPIAAPPPTASQFPDPETVRAAASLGPDGTPTATRPTSGTDSGEAAQANDVAKPPAKPAPEAASETGAIEQPSTPKLDAPTKLSKRASAHVVVASTDTTSPSAAMETPSHPRQLRAPAKPKKAARAAPKAPPAAAEPQAAPQQAAPQVAADPLTAPPVPHTPPQEPANPLARAFGELGALAAPATSTRQPVESTPPTGSGWAVQLAASKSETEAKSDAARLNARYASALNGAVIGVHKARANVATGYRLRVVGLSKADAAALCARLKGHGGDCFILKSVTTLISTSP